MTIQPSSPEELRRSLAEFFSRGQKVGDIDLSGLNRVVAFTPEDMTVTVEAGLTIDQLQTELARQRQWLPLDPPNPAQLSIGALLATNASGPRRFGCGTARDHTIGLKVVLADGRLISSGGLVVKNVAGYDLAKLFIGSRGSLGVIVQATFKLRPLPEAEEFVQARCPSLDNAAALIESVAESELTPVVVDLHNLDPSPAMAGSGPPPFFVVLGFAGSTEEVAWQKDRAALLGLTEAGHLGYEAEFWNNQLPAQCISVLPSRLTDTVRGLDGVSFVARAGNGLIYCRAGPAATRAGSPAGLIQRLKNEFDPKHILPEVPL